MSDVPAYRFDVATTVTAVDAAPGVWVGAVDPRFSVGGRTNGGYLLALATRAALAEVESVSGRHLDPVAVSGAFVSVAPPGPVHVATEVLRVGRGSTIVRAAVRSIEDAPDRYLEATVTFGTLPEPSEAADPAEHVHDLVPTVDLPPEEECVRLPTQGPGFEVALMGEMSERLDPACSGWTRGDPSGVGELRGWVRFDDDRPVDPLALVLAADCLPPATFDLGLTGWVPTMHLSVWLRARPAPGPLRVRQVARVVAGGSADPRTGTVDEVCDIWDGSGSLVATGHQLAGLRLPG